MVKTYFEWTLCFNTKFLIKCSLLLVYLIRFSDNNNIFYKHAIRSLGIFDSTNLFHITILLQSSGIFYKHMKNHETSQHLCKYNKMTTKDLFRDNFQILISNFEWNYFSPKSHYRLYLCGCTMCTFKLSTFKQKIFRAMTSYMFNVGDGIKKISTLITISAVSFNRPMTFSATLLSP